MSKKRLMDSTSNPRIQRATCVYTCGTSCLITLLCCFVLLLTLSGCGIRHTSFAHLVGSNGNSFLSDEERARLYDIAFPQEAQPAKLQAQEGQTIITYTSTGPAKGILDLYRADMEYHGWDLVGSFEGQESCLIFEKPTKRCVVTMKSDMNGLISVVLFLGSK